MTRDDDIDLLAGEYVLGTLAAAERADVELRRAREPHLDAAIRDWEERLAPLVEGVAEVAPPAGTLARIEAVLDRRQATGAPAPAPAPVLVASAAEASRLKREATRWKAAAGFGYLIAACLAGFVVFREVYPPEPEGRFVAVFQSNDEQPAFILTIDLKTRELLVRPVTAEPKSGKTYQLWIAAKELGDKPKSLGLLDDPVGPTRKRLTDYDPRLLETATFGISLEPPGGSPTGVPTGPAIHGKLLPTAL